MANQRETEPHTGGAEQDPSELSDAALESVAGGRRISPLEPEPPSIGLPVEPIVDYAPEEFSGG